MRLYCKEVNGGDVVFSHYSEKLRWRLPLDVAAALLPGQMYDVSLEPIREVPVVEQDACRDPVPVRVVAAEEEKPKPKRPFFRK